MLLNYCVIFYCYVYEVSYFHPKLSIIFIIIQLFCAIHLGLINWYQSMTTNRERIESLKTNVYDIKDDIRRLEEGATSSIDHMQRIEDALKEISTFLLVSHGTVGRQPFGTYKQGGPSRGFHHT